MWNQCDVIHHLLLAITASLLNNCYVTLCIVAYLWLHTLMSSLLSSGRVPSALSGRVLHQEHERWGDVGQRGAGGFSGCCEERVAAWEAQRHQHHFSTGPGRTSPITHQWSERGVRSLKKFDWNTCHGPYMNVPKYSNMHLYKINMFIKDIFTVLKVKEMYYYSN